MKTAIEGEETRSKEGWMALCDIDSIQWTELLERGVFVALQNEHFALNFVGQIITKRQAILALPKFYSGPPVALAQDEIRLLLAALEHYFHRVAGGAVKEQSARCLAFRDFNAFSEYEAYLALNAWYQTHGIYRTEMRTDKSTYGRRVHWPKTLATTLPLHSDVSTIHPWPVRLNSANAFNMVSEIQVSALAYLGTKYAMDREQMASPDDLARFGSISGHDLIERREQWVQHIQREMSVVFKTDTLSMLHALKSYLEDLEGLSGHRSIRLFGTNSFHAVWEDACAIALEDGKEISIDRLAQPVWEFITPDKRFPGGKQRPDAMNEYGDVILISDAKYFYRVPDVVCGWADLVKQHVYLMSLENPDAKPLINVLLFPDLQANDAEVIGFVRMEGKSGPANQFQPIWVGRLNARKILSNYSRLARFYGVALRLVEDVRAIERSKRL